MHHQNDFGWQRACVSMVRLCACVHASSRGQKDLNQRQQERLPVFFGYVYNWIGFVCVHMRPFHVYICVCVRPFHCHSHSTITLYRNASKESSVLGLQSNVNMRCSRRTNSLLKICSNEFPLQFYSIYSLFASLSPFPIVSSLFPAYSSWPNHGRLLVDW